MCLVSGVAFLMLDTVQSRLVIGRSWQNSAIRWYKQSNLIKLPELIQTSYAVLYVNQDLAICSAHILLGLLQLFHLKIQPSRMQ